MDSRTLHWMARRYLMDRYEELCSTYAQLPNQGRAADGFHYSARALRIFPRYNVVEAMLVEVERLPGLHPLAHALIHAADLAQSPFTQPPQGKVEEEVISDERRRFSLAVASWMSVPDLDVEPVGYRRVLTPEESADWRRRVQRWGLQDLSWYPMLAGPVPEDVLILKEASMWEPQGVARVRTALREMGVQRVAELREYGADYLLDIELFAPTYSGAEGVWTDGSLGWIAYASHEGTVAFGGQLAGVLSVTWRNLEEWRWPGW